MKPPRAQQTPQTAGTPKPATWMHPGKALKTQALGMQLASGVSPGHSPQEETVLIRHSLP